MVGPIVSIEELIEADCWGVEIKKQNGKSIRLYDAYNRKCCRWWNERNRSAAKAISLTKVGDTIVVYMFVSDGFNVLFTRTETGWDIKYLKSKFSLA